MWKPDIHETEEYEITEKHSNKVKLQQRYDKYKDMVLWETANFAKCGDAILYTQSADKDPKSGKGTERGLEWMKSLLTDYHFIEVPAGGHIDGKLALIESVKSDVTEEISLDDNERSQFMNSVTAVKKLWEVASNIDPDLKK